MRITTHLHQHRGWLLAVVLVTAFSLLVAFVPAQAAPPHVADPVNLEQIFLNVMNNAFTAMQSGGRLDIEVSNTHPDHVVILFEDTGCGIPQKDIQYVFEPFFSSKSTGTGTGLGLSVTYALVKELGGKILVTSAEEKGTRFIIELPLEPPPKEDGTANANPGVEV